MVDSFTPTEIILLKTKPFYRFDTNTPDDQVLSALRQLLEQWSEIINSGKDATEDELFYLNVTRGLLHRIFTLGFIKNLFQNDHTLTREIFELGSNFLLTQLDIFIIENPSTFSISNICSIMELLSALIVSLRYTDIDLINERLFISMREYIDQNSSNNNLIDGILAFLWSVSDHTSLVPKLVEMKYVNSLYQWIQSSPTRFRNDQLNAMINILQNMSRHDDAIEQFNQLEILTMIDQLPFNCDLSTSFQIIRILLTDAYQIKLESMEFLMQLITITISAGESEDYRHEGAHVCELLTILTKLFYNNDILMIILNSKPTLVEFFMALLMKLYPNISADSSPLQNYTCVLLMNILCCISYQQDYFSMIYNNEELMDVIENMMKNEIDFIDIFMPRTMKSIEQTANEIWKIFNDKSPSISFKTDDV